MTYCIPFSVLTTSLHTNRRALKGRQSYPFVGILIKVWDAWKPIMTTAAHYGTRLRMTLVYIFNSLPLCFHVPNKAIVSNISRFYVSVYLSTMLILYTAYPCLLYSWFGIDMETTLLTIVLPMWKTGATSLGKRTGLELHGSLSSGESGYSFPKRSRNDGHGGVPLFDLNVPAEVVDKIWNMHTFCNNCIVLIVSNFNHRGEWTSCCSCSFPF